MTNAFDTAIFSAVHGFAGASRLLDAVGIFLAEYLAYVLLLAVVVFLWKEQRWQRRFYVIFLAGLAMIFSRGVMTELIWRLYDRPRPFVALAFEPLIAKIASPSFPSGHAAMFFALATVLFFVRRRWGIWFFVLTVLMGYARVLVGVHWPSDVFAGAVVGIAGGVAAHALLPKPREAESGG